MSLILDALNKADHDRNKNTEHPDDAGSEGGASAHRMPQKMKIGVATGAFCVVLILAGGAFYWGKNHGKATVELAPTSEQAPTSLAAIEQQPNAAPQQATAKQTAPQVKRPPIAKAPGIKKGSPTDQKAIDAQYARATASKTPNAVKIDTKPSEVAALYEQQNKPKTPPPTPAPTAVPTPAPTPAPTPKPTPQESEIPKLEDFTEIGSIRSLPWTVQETIPTLTYSAHQFESMQNGSVVINGKESRRGDTIEKGLVIEMILPDGIILRYDGRVFKVPALNSWVNM